MKIAILGGGFLGACTALECARRGLAVDLYERHDELVTEAGLVNEGKIHLGHVYANDASLRTASRLMRGALTFTRDLARWLDLAARPLVVSPPFQYAVPHASALSVAAIEDYLGRCAHLYRELATSLDARYLDVATADDAFFAPLPRRMWDETYHADALLAVYDTVERSVDPADVAARLRAAVRAAPIGLRLGSLVQSVAPRAGGAWEVAFEHAGAAAREGYDAVVNCLWSGRLGIDAQLGLAPTRPWLHRYKLGLRLALPAGARRPPTVTLVHGPFGDVVDFGDHGVYVSWYPSGMIGMSSELVPPDWGARVDAAARRRIAVESMRALGAVCPALAEVHDDVLARAVVRGGAIFAWGASDIDDLASELHQRSDIGIASHGSYHSIDPGKYTMVPGYAREVVERIAGSGSGAAR